MQNNSFEEFTEHFTESNARIDSIKVMQNQLLNHISLLENIITLLETRMAGAKNPDDKFKISKSITYNFEKLIKLYDVYRTYEDTMQRYYTSLSDNINKKYRFELDVEKNKKDEKSTDFFRKLNEYLVDNKNIPNLEIDEVDSGLEL